MRSERVAVSSRQKADLRGFLNLGGLFFYLFAYNPFMSTPPARRTYFGIAAFFTSLLAVLAIGSNLGVSQMNITPEEFSQLNSITAMFYCVLTPLAFALGVLGLFFKNDSKILAGLAIIITAIPFLILVVQLLASLSLTN